MKIPKTQVELYLFQLATLQIIHSLRYRLYKKGDKVTEKKPEVKLEMTEREFEAYIESALEISKNTTLLAEKSLLEQAIEQAWVDDGSGKYVFVKDLLDIMQEIREQRANS